MTTQAEVRRAFWATFCAGLSEYRNSGKRQNDLPADVRVAFVDYVDSLARSGEITEALAQRVTL